MADEPVLAALVAELQALRKELSELRAQLEASQADNAELRRLLFGRRSERLPDARRGAAKRARDAQDPAEREASRKEKRKAARAAREELPVEERTLDVPEADRICPCCGSDDLSPLGEGVVSEQIEFVPAHLVRIRWTRRRYACGCGKGIVTAPSPPQVKEGCEYGPGLHAHVVVSKCADALPFYRLSKRLGRSGMAVSRATLCTLFHRAADSIDALYKRMLKEIPAAEHVFADETPLPVLAEGGCKKGYVWTFVSDRVVAFTYSATRSGDTPVAILGGSNGTLQVDGYTGYNKVTTPDGRARAGCWAHVRRKFFRSLQTAPDAAGHAMDQIALLYDVEHRAQAKGIVGTPEHRALRRAGAGPVVDALFAWLAEQQVVHPPKSPMGRAVRYALRQETALRLFLDDARVAVDNNTAERALKPVALGRKNFLFAGTDEGAQNLARLQTVVATCQRHGVNPQAWLEDVMVRVHTHPAKRIDELMPWNWAPSTP